MTKKLMMLAMLAVAFGAWAATLSNAAAKQRYPWNGKVDITYTLTGDVTAGLPAWNMPRLFVTASNRVDGTIYAAATSALSGDTGTAEGAHHVVWNMDVQGLKIKSDEVVFAITYVDTPKPYCVIDLSGGANASSYPVTYVASVPSGGFNTDEYKTTKLVLRLIEPGTFMMGGSYQVTLTKPFYCGVFEVTQKQYELVTGSNPSSYKGDMRPVEQVSWNTIRGNSSTYNWPSSANVDSSTFVGKLQARTGLNFDLPTEAQWEYACRAWTTSTYNNGGDTENDLKQLGRYSGNQSDGKGGFSPHTKVGSYEPNAWGLYDMHGNVYEWCLDWYGSLSSGVTDPVGSSSGEYRVIRGGCWGIDAAYCTSSYRNDGRPSGVYNYCGFRLVRTLSNTEGERSPEAAAGAERADALCAAEAAPVAIDSRTDMVLVFDSVILTWDAAWIGGDTNAMVVIADNGTEVKRTTGAGAFTHTLTGYGRHELTYTTYIDGVAQDEVYTATVYKDWKYEVVGGGAVITETTQTSGAVTIPAEIDGYPVIGIESGVFKDCTGLTSVTIPDSVTGIGMDAFRGCSNIVSVTMPSDTTINESLHRWMLHRWSFNGDLGDSVGGSNATIIGAVTTDGVKYNLPGGSSGSAYIDLGDNLVPDGMSAVTLEFWATQNERGSYDRIFDFGSMPVGYDFSSGNTSCYSSDNIRMFWGHPGYTDADGGRWSLELGKEYHIAAVFTDDRPSWKVTFLIEASDGSGYFFKQEMNHRDGWSFDDVGKTEWLLGQPLTCWDSCACASYNEVRILKCALSEEAFREGTRLGPDLMGSIGGSVSGIFPDSYALITNITVLGNSTEVPSRFFEGCAGLTEIQIPSTVTNIGAEAFASCSNLTEVVIPNSVWDVGEGAFANCTNLRRVEAAKGLKGTLEARNVFEGCPANLEIVYVETATISDVTAKQRYPWNGKVDITYTLTGDVTAGFSPEAEIVLSVTASNRVDGTTYAADASALSGDTGTAEGAHHVVWDLNAQGIEFVSDDVLFTVAYVPVMRYCVVDLAAGANATSYPVTYVSSVTSEVFNTDEYKTTKLVLRLIGPGSFMMNGSYSTTLTKPFYCGVFEVTQKQYELVTGSNPSSYKGDMRPVERVSWNTIRGNSSTYNWPGSANVDSNSFVGRLQARTGLNFDLPTEAQWEYACRAGTTSTYNNGGDTENDLKQLGRYSGDKSDGKGGYTDAHTKVGSYEPNAWGLYDMHGNVWEWCLDWYGSLSSGVTDPVGPSSGSSRVLRGGCWGSNAGNCTSSYRSSNGPSNDFNYYIGFRLVRTLSNREGERSPEAVAGAERADALCAAEAAPVAIDSRTDMVLVFDSVILTWDAAWIGGDTNATVVIADNGTEVKRATGAGEWMYQLSGLGSHNLTYTTYVGGVAQSDVYEADVFLKGHVADESISAVLLDADAYVYDGTAKRPAYHLRDTARDPDLNVAAYAPGDVDGDGVLTSNDVLLMQRYIAYLSLSDAQKERFASYNLTGDALAAADANGDGAVDANDVAWMQTRFECYDMVEGTDYTVAYSDNVNAGTGKLTITGMGNYGGTVTLTFTIARATIGADGEPGTGEVPAGGVSKCDAEFVYDGLGHAINTNGLTSITVDGKSPAISYSLDGAEGWQTAPFVFTNACTTSVWYRLEVANFNDYVHEARLTIAPKSVADASVETELLETTFLHDGTAHVPAASVVDSAVFRWLYVTPFDAGDVDGDGVLTYDDMDLIDQHVAYLGLDESVKPLFEEFALMGAALAAADVNGDGDVDAADMDALELCFRTLEPGVDYVVVCRDNVSVGTATAMVAGIGNYTGTVERTFEITLRNIAGAEVTLGDALTYTGAAQTQAVAGVTVDGVPATFTVSGNVGTDAGDYELTVTGTGNFTGTTTARWTIAPRDIAGAEVTLGASLVYDGTEQTMAVTGVTVDGLPVTFTVSGNVGTAAGNYVLTVTGTGNFTGTVTKEWKIAQARIVASAQSYDGVYDGEGHGIAVEVMSPEGAAVKYSITEAGPYSQGAILFTNMLAAATTVWYRVEADNYEVASGSALVSIAPRSITNAVVSVAGSVAYAGAAARPSVTVTDEGTTGMLVEGEDYTLAYADNMAVGTATVTVTGIGNYAGTVERTFEITSRNISGATVTLGDALTYAGAAQTQAVAVVMVDGVSATFTVIGNVGTDAGNYELTVTGTGNFTGTTTARWTIAPRSITNCVAAVAESVAYDGGAATPEVTVTDTGLGDVVLAEGVDYVVSYTNNTAVGTATVTVAGIGNYADEIDATFEVTKGTQRIENTATGGLAPTTFTFDGTEKSVAYVSDGVLPNETVDVTVSGTTNAVHAGTYTAVVNGVISGFSTDDCYNYVYETAIRDLALQWTILPRSGAGLGIALDRTVAFRTGSPICVGVAVRDAERGATLEEVADYTLKYADNVEAGVATVRVCFTNDYAGTVTRTYRILPDMETLPKISLTPASGVCIGIADVSFEYPGIDGLETCLRYTLDGTDPTAESAILGEDGLQIEITSRVTVKVAAFCGDLRVSEVAETWYAPPVYVSFAAGGAAGNVPEPLFNAEGFSVILPGVGNLSLAKHSFAGWSDGETTWQPGDSYAVGATNVTLAAQWTAKTVPVPPINAPHEYDGMTAEVTLSGETGSVIYYTTDGSEPSAANGTRYAGVFNVEGTVTVKAVAVMDDHFDSPVAVLEVRRSWGTYNSCLDNDRLVFTSGGDVPWIGTLETSTTGVSSVRSGAIGDSQASWIETTVIGEGTVTFWCRTSSEIYKNTPVDFFSFSIDGGEVVRLGGETAWTNLSFTVTGEGGHVLRWEYSKDVSDAQGRDCAWVDAVAWMPNGALADIIVDAGNDKTVTVPRTWIAQYPDLVAAAGGDAEAAVKDGTAANGRKVWECYVVGLDPEIAMNDFKITSFPMKADGTPDLANMAFAPPQEQWNVPGARAVVKGAATLDGEWKSVEGATAVEKAAMRFFKVVVEVP